MHTSVTGTHWAVKTGMVEGIYYDGINFDRRSFQRVRKVLDRASAEPLIDIHTGEVADAPSSLRYIGHFAFADSVWNGEGFRFDEDKWYWLVDTSGFQHGIPADRLGGGGLDARGMLFASYQRNSPQSQELWKFWDAYKIDEAILMGWWEDDCPVNVTLPPPAPPPPPPPPPPPGTCAAFMAHHHMKDAYPQSMPASPSYAIAFGSNKTGCGNPSNNKYPMLTLAEAIAACCQLGAECAGSSIARLTMLLAVHIIVD